MSSEGIQGHRHWKIKKRDGSRLEPANLDVLRHWVETGQIGPDDRVIHEDLADWILASEAVELDDLFKKQSITLQKEPTPVPEAPAKPKEEEEEVKVPDCAFHPGRTASEICVGCGKFICEECGQRSDHKVYCRRCMAEKQVGAEPGAPVGAGAISAIGAGGDRPPVISGYAITSLVIAILGLLGTVLMIFPKPNVILAPAVGFVALIAALLGALAYGRIRKREKSLRGTGIALGGLTLGAITMVGTLAAVLMIGRGESGIGVDRGTDASLPGARVRRVLDSPRESMEKQEEDAKLLKDRAGELLSANDLAGTIEQCNLILRLYPDTETAKIIKEQLPLLVAEQQRREAEMEAVKGRNEEVAQSAYDKAMSMYSGGDKAAALEFLKNLVSDYPDTVAAKKSRDLLEEEDKKAEEERQRKDEEQAQDLLVEASDLLASDKFAEAAQQYRQITENYPQTSVFSEATLGLKKAEALVNDPAEREFHSIQKDLDAMTYDESIQKIQNFLGKYPTSDRAVEARTLLDENVQNKRTADNLYNFGRSYLDDGKYEIAIGRFGKLLQDYPRSRWIPQAKKEYEDALRKAEE